MFEFIGAFRIVGHIEYEYVKILANSFDEANNKLEEYLENNKISWIETGINQIMITID